MRTKRFFTLSISIIILLACDFSSLGGSDSADDSGDGDDTSVQDQIEATTSAQQTATAEIEKAISDGLTDAAPPPSDTPVPATDTPVPTDTPAATDTPEPTDTLVPTTAAPVVSYQTSSGDCKGETANVEFRNNSGATATVTLVRKDKDRTCSYFIFLASVGSSWFWVEPGLYTITMKSCHGTSTFDNTLNSNWWFRFKAC